MLVQRKFKEVIFLDVFAFWKNVWCCAREIVVCACYGGLTAEVDSRLPAKCRGNTGEADDAESEIWIPASARPEAHATSDPTRPELQRR
jgi:hypothetical protein